MAAHSVPLVTLPIGTQDGVPPVQSIWPRRQTFAGVHAAPAEQVSLQVFVSSQEPPEHAVPMASKASRGHALLVPSQTSAMSHSPASARHSVPAGTRASSGHSVLAPSQTSAASQSPAASRHVIPALPGPAPVQTGIPVEQSKRPSSHALPVSQGMPQEGAPASNPASSGGPPSPGPASPGPASPVDASAMIPASPREACTQPTSLSQYSVLPQAPTMGMKRHAPSGVHTPVAQAAGAMQSLSPKQPSSHAA